MRAPNVTARTWLHKICFQEPNGLLAYMQPAREAIIFDLISSTFRQWLSPCKGHYRWQYRG